MHRVLLAGALLFGTTAFAQTEDTDAGTGDAGEECVYDPYTGTNCGSGGGGGGAGPYDDDPRGCGCGAAPGSAVLGAVMLAAALRHRRR